MPWATEEELELARDIAEQGLRLLIKITKHVNLYDSRIKDGFIKYNFSEEQQSSSARRLYENILPEIEELSAYSTWGDSPNSSIQLAIRTLERNWKGNPVRPFINCEEEMYGFYTTAHEACIDWAQGFKNLAASEGEGDKEHDILFASEVFELDKSQYADLSLQIVTEWRDALNWIGQNNSSQIQVKNDSIENSVPFQPSPEKLADAIQLSEDIDFIHESLERLIEESTSNIRTIRTVELLDCRKVTGFCLACKRLAMFAIHNGLGKEAKSLMRLTRRNSGFYGELVESDDYGPMCFELSDEVQVMLDSLDIALLPHAPEKKLGADKTVLEWQNRILYLNGVEIGKYKPAAKNQIAILDAFQEESWPKHIDDPLPPNQTDPGTRLRDTIRSLNEKQDSIEFLADGTGQGVEWKLRVSSKGVDANITPTENT